MDELIKQLEALAAKWEDKRGGEAWVCAQEVKQIINRATAKATKAKPKRMK